MKAEPTGELRPAVGEIVQLDPEKTAHRAFAACLMVVDEVRSWGVQGYVQALGEDPQTMGGQAYYRAAWGTFERTGGTVVWEPGPGPEGETNG